MRLRAHAERLLAWLRFRERREWSRAKHRTSAQEFLSLRARYAQGAPAAQDIKIGLVRLGCRLNRQTRLARVA